MPDELQIGITVGLMADLRTESKGFIHGNGEVSGNRPEIFDRGGMCLNGLFASAENEPIQKTRPMLHRTGSGNATRKIMISLLIRIIGQLWKRRMELISGV